MTNTTNLFPLRRRLKCELNEIPEVIKRSFLTDAKTKQIALWASCFFEDLKTNEEEGVRDAYIPPLQRMLRDPLFYTPLGSTSVLGQDGKTYTDAALLPSSFRTTPHTVVRHMAKWLNSHGALNYSITIESYLKELETPIQIEEVDDTFEKELTELEKGLEETFAAQKRDFVRLREKTEGITAPFLEIQTNITIKSMTQEIEAYAREVSSQIKAQEAKNLELMTKFKEMSSQLKQQNKVLEEQNRDLKSALIETKEKLDVLEKQQTVLEKNTEAAKQALDDLNDSFMNSVSRVVACVALSVLATYGVQTLLNSSAVGASVMPGGQGATLGFKVNF